MSDKNNEFTGLSQTDQEALELGRRIKTTFHYEDVANFLDKALFLIATHPHLDNCPMPSNSIIENMFSLKWMFAEKKGGDIV